jgi:hypothetical protein
VSSRIATPLLNMQFTTFPVIMLLATVFPIVSNCERRCDAPEPEDEDQKIDHYEYLNNLSGVTQAAHRAQIT